MASRPHWTEHILRYLDPSQAKSGLVSGRRYGYCLPVPPPFSLSLLRLSYTLFISIFFAV
jgi:hypothetical protein